MKKTILYSFVLLAVSVMTIGTSFASFMQSDFELSIDVDKTNYQSGEVVSFLASLKNLSADTMNFGGNIKNISTSLSPYVGSESPWNSPYVDGSGFTPYAFPSGLDGVAISPGSTYIIPFYYIDTAANIPSGTEVKIAPAFPGLPSFNLFFANIPPDNPAVINDPNAWDFIVSSTDISTATATTSAIPTPEPSTFLLLIAGGVVVVCGRLILKSAKV